MSTYPRGPMRDTICDPCFRALGPCEEKTLGRGGGFLVFCEKCGTPVDNGTMHLLGSNPVQARAGEEACGAEFSIGFSPHRHEDGRLQVEKALHCQRPKDHPPGTYHRAGDMDWKHPCHARVLASGTVSACYHHLGHGHEGDHVDADGTPTPAYGDGKTSGCGAAHVEDNRFLRLCVLDDDGHQTKREAPSFRAGRKASRLTFFGIDHRSPACESSLA